MNTTKVIKEIVSMQSKAFIVIGVLLLLNLCLYLYSAVYQLPRIERLQSNWFEKRKAMTDGTALDISAEYRKGEEDLKAWRARILPKKKFPGFIGNLFDLAEDNSLAIKGISYKSTELKNESLAAYTIDFSVSGKYAAVKSFISDIQRLHEMITIDNVSLSSGKNTEDSVALKMQMTVYLRTGEQ